MKWSVTAYKRKSLIPDGSCINPKRHDRAQQLQTDTRRRYYFQAMQWSVWVHSVEQCSLNHWWIFVILAEKLFSYEHSFCSRSGWCIISLASAPKIHRYACSMQGHNLLQRPPSGIPGDFEYTFFPLFVLTEQVWHCKWIPRDSDVRKWINKRNENKKWVGQHLENPTYHLYVVFASNYFSKMYYIIVTIIWRLDRFRNKQIKISARKP